MFRGDEREQLDLLDLARVLLARWQLAFGLPVACAAVAGVISLVLPRVYVAEVRFVPESDQRRAGLAGSLALASLAGSRLGLSLTGAEYSPDFYAQLVDSRTIFDAVLLSSFPVSGGDTSERKPLLDILKVRGKTQVERLDRGARKLEKRVSTSVARTTGVVTVRFEARDPDLAAEVANEFMNQLQRFNTETRQLQARERRKFTEGRMADAQRDLTAAEDSLKRFLLANRRYEEAPRLRFEYDRLQRQINIAQESFLTLRRQYGEARIDEVNDTPVLTVVDSARAPQRPSRPHKALIMLLAFLVGGIAGVTGAVGREAAEKLAARGDQGYQRLRTEWGRLKAQARRLLQRRP